MAHSRANNRPPAFSVAAHCLFVPDIRAYDTKISNRASSKGVRSNVGPFRVDASNNTVTISLYYPLKLSLARKREGPGDTSLPLALFLIRHHARNLDLVRVATSIFFPFSLAAKRVSSFPLRRCR
jgi:hypothetical protein